MSTNTLTPKRCREQAATLVAQMETVVVGFEYLEQRLSFYLVQGDLTYSDVGTSKERIAELCQSYHGRYAQYLLGLFRMGSKWPMRKKYEITELLRYSDLDHEVRSELEKEAVELYYRSQFLESRLALSKDELVAFRHGEFLGYTIEAEYWLECLRHGYGYPEIALGMIATCLRNAPELTFEQIGLTLEETDLYREHLPRP